MKFDLACVNYKDNLDVTSYTPYCQNFSFDHTNPCWLNVIIGSNNNTKDDTPQYMNISNYFDYPYNNSFSIPNNLLFLSLESLQFTFSPRDIRNYIRKFSLEQTYFSFYLGQAFLVSFKPISVVYLTSNIFSNLELNPQIEQLPISLESNRIQIGISFRSMIHRSERHEYYTRK
jgi:hypothetical protein